MAKSLKNAPLHDAFLRTLKQLEVRYQDLPKPLRIRVERWVSKLAYHVENPTWIRERNQYAAALLDASERYMVWPLQSLCASIMVQHLDGPDAVLEALEYESRLQLPRCTRRRER